MKNFNFKLKASALLGMLTVLPWAIPLAYGQMDFVHVTYRHGMSPAATAAAATQPNISYNGGQVLPNSTTYAIF